MHFAFNLLLFSVSLFYVCYIIYQTPANQKLYLFAFLIFIWYFLTSNSEEYFLRVSVMWALYFLWLLSFIFFMFTIYLYENINTLKIIGEQELFITTLFEKMT
jgi:hypothetical protein